MTLANNLHVSPYDGDEKDNVQLESCPKTATNNDEYQKAITPRSMRYFILISTIIESIIFSGLIFGWPALFYMLKNEQIYSYLCPNNNYSVDDDDIDDFDINQTTINPNDKVNMICLNPFKFTINNNIE